MDISRAVVEVVGLNQVRINLPPWDITATVDSVDDRPVLVDLRVRNAAGITTSGLATLPIRGITMLAAGAVWGGEESFYRRLATPLEDSRHRRPAKKPRSWPEEHYRRVGAAAAWAAKSGRSGGPAEAVAEFWGVHVRTARRWLAKVSLLEEGAGEQEQAENPATETQGSE